MAASKAFVLFPPPLPPVPKLGLPNPHVRRPSLSHRAIVGSPTETVVKSENGESVIIKIEEPDAGRPRSSDIGIAITTHSRPHSRASSTDSAIVVVPASPIDGHTSLSSPHLYATPPQDVPPRQATPANFKPPPVRPVNSPSQSARSESATLVRSNSMRSNAVSPVAPLRSIFPIYNPELPLSQQSYYPQRPTSLQPRYMSRDDYSSRVGTPSQCGRAIGEPRTAPPSICSFAADVMSIPEMRYSSQNELEKLWEASHGMEANASIGSFDLEMARYGR